MIAAEHGFYSMLIQDTVNALPHGLVPEHDWRQHMQCSVQWYTWPAHCQITEATACCVL